jgi:hypothetical protein
MTRFLLSLVLDLLFGRQEQIERITEPKFDGKDTP